MKNYLKRNKPLLLLPLILVPFIVLIFYILGGGEHPKTQGQSQEKKDSVKGANYKLPEADKDIRIYDKMEGAQSQKQATASHDYNILGEKDSLDQVSEIGTGNQDLTEHRQQEQPNRNTELNADVSNNLLAHIKKQEEQARKDLLGGQGQAQQSENNPVESISPVKVKPKKKAEQPDDPSNTINPTGIEELDKVFNRNIALSRRNDSLSTRLQKATAQLRQIEDKKNKRFALETNTRSGFKNGENNPAMIEAEVYETTTVLTGNRVKLRLLQDSWLKGTKISKNTFLYGTCKVENERLQIEVAQIPVGGKFIPVEITIYDLDGLPGLYVPDNASRKVAKEVGSSVNTSSMLGVTNNPLTYAGIQAADKTAQSLIKMIRIKKVTIRKNTLVYLINTTK